MSVLVAGHKVGPIGYGLSGLATTRQAEPMSDDQIFNAIRAALASGCNLWDGGVFYGTPENNSLTLLGKYYAKYPEDAGKIVLNIKGAMESLTVPDGSPENIRAEIDTCLKQLGGRGKIDMYECARRDPKVPLKDTLLCLDELVKVGKIGAIALSEVNAKTIREAAAITKIAAVEIELSLWQTDPLTNGITQTCADLDIPIIAYSPIGRGMLTGHFTTLSSIPRRDIRHHLPRFQPENFSANIIMVNRFKKVAEKKKCTPAQLALGWLITLSNRPDMPTIIPIPGSTSAERVKENAAAVALTEEEMMEIDDVLRSVQVRGERYHEAGMELADG